METPTKGCYWYHDTPEQPFVHTKGSIWLINPETENWMLELQKDGHLWYHDKIFDTFSKYLNMKEIDFESFIGLWVEEALKRGVVSTRANHNLRLNVVEDALKRGVVSTDALRRASNSSVEDVLERGVVSTCSDFRNHVQQVKDVIENGKQWN